MRHSPGNHFLIEESDLEFHDPWVNRGSASAQLAFVLAYADLNGQNGACGLGEPMFDSGPISEVAELRVEVGCRRTSGTCCAQCEFFAFDPMRATNTDCSTSICLVIIVPSDFAVG
jgi:hypothetical protein